MKVTDLDFHLPASLIAYSPAEPRDSCRLLVLRRDGSLEHRRFAHLHEYLHAGDLLLLNDTKVFPARLTGKKTSGGKIEILLVRETSPGVWDVLTRERYTGQVRIAGELSAEMVRGKTLAFAPLPEGGGDLGELLRKLGSMPLPPYIRRMPEERDRIWYQTVYARSEGSIASPTAGLHFSPELLSMLERKGVLIRSLTLHVGPGTFKPIRVEKPEEHVMDAETFEIPAGLLHTIRAVKEAGKRLVAVGTTSTRAIEGFFSGMYEDDRGSRPAPSLAAAGKDRSVRGTTRIFIYPGYQFKVVDSLLTNFHLPGSTPLMLTSALSSPENLLEAYRTAVRMEYSFFSYGDAMLIL